MSTDHIMLSNSQKKDILKKFREIDMHKELKILFEKMFPYDTSIYITHGRDEMGRDLIISKTTPIGTENTSIVVKMDKLSGSASDKSVNEIIMQINQCFQVPKSVNDQFNSLKTKDVYVLVFGEISNKVKDNLTANLKIHEGKIEYFDIEKILSFFTDYYPNIFLGASGLEALHTKYNELEKKMLKKNKFLKTSYIEPNLRIFKKSKKHLLAISNSSDTKKVGKTLNDNIFGERENIESLSKKIMHAEHRILVEGEAGSGKTIFVLKLTMHIIENAIKELDIKKSRDIEHIDIPIAIKATDLKNGKNLKDIIGEYYNESSTFLKTNLLIIDAIDEVSNDIKDEIIQEAEEYCNSQHISLMFTTRKSTEVKKKLYSYNNYELLPVETSQAINYIKSILGKNKILISSLLKGLEQLKHQIPLYPMSLSLLIEIAEKQHEIPASISELYKRYIEIALSQESDGEKIHVLFEPNIKKDFFESLAYEMYYLKNTTTIKKDEFDIFINEYIEKFPIITDKKAFISDLRRTSLIKIDESIIEFLHKSFLDYFISSYFNNRQTELYDEHKFDEIYQLYHTSLWEDVTYFYFGQRTRITKKEIDKIINNAPEENSNLLNHLSKFMIGKLIQYAWHTKSLDKEYAILSSVTNVLEMKNELSKFVEDEIGMKLPKIVGDIQMLHYIDEAFSSRFLVDEIKNVTKDLIDGKSTFDVNLFYFSTLFMIENATLLGDEFVEKCFNHIIAIADKPNKIPPEVSVPLINIISLFINNNKLKTTEENIKSLNVINKKLKKRYKELTIDYLSFKSKLDQHKISQLGKK